MKTWTYAELKSNLLNELDLLGEEFVTPEELLSYFNGAIDAAEAEIHKLAVEDEYFLTKETIPLVQGVQEYTMPSNIYANKIRRIVYQNGQRVYTINRFRGSKMFEDIAATQIDPGNYIEYKYIIRNDSAAVGPKIVLYPAAQETNPTAVTIWFVRNANRLVTEADVLDIPEFASFVLKYAKVKCMMKESHPAVQIAIGDLEQERQLMIDTLSDMVPDEDNKVEMDLSYYREMV